MGVENTIGGGKEQYKEEKTRRSPVKMLSAHTPLKGPETVLCTILGIPEIGRANGHELRGLEKGLDRSEFFSFFFSSSLISSICSTTVYVVT